jgi:hypothetical protein
VVSKTEASLEGEREPGEDLGGGQTQEDSSLCWPWWVVVS